MNLYEIDQQIEACIDEETGEVKFDNIEELQMQKEEKLENLLLWIKDLKAEAEAIAKEISRLQKRKEAAEHRAESIKAYLLTYLNGEKFKTPRVSVSYRNTKTVAIDDVYQLPEQYVKYAEPEPDKLKLRADLDILGEIPGCHLENKQSMIIK